MPHMGGWRDSQPVCCSAGRRCRSRASARGLAHAMQASTGGAYASFYLRKLALIWRLAEVPFWGDCVQHSFGALGVLPILGGDALPIRGREVAASDCVRVLPVSVGHGQISLAHPPTRGVTMTTRVYDRACDVCLLRASMCRAWVDVCGESSRP